MANAIYTSWKAIQMSKADIGSYASGPVDFLGDTVKVALLTDSYTAALDADTDQFWSDISAYEVSSTNYTAGGAAIASKVINNDTTNHRGTFDSTADVTWTTVSFSARWAVIYKSTGTAGTSPLIAAYDFGEVKTASNGNFTLTWSDSGILAIG